jgi:hypothetical protein
MKRDIILALSRKRLQMYFYTLVVSSWGSKRIYNFNKFEYCCDPKDTSLSRHFDVVEAPLGIIITVAYKTAHNACRLLNMTCCSTSHSAEAALGSKGFLQPMRAMEGHHSCLYRAQGWCHEHMPLFICDHQVSNQFFID